MTFTHIYCWRFTSSGALHCFDYCGGCFQKSKIFLWENTKTKFWNYFKRVKTYNTNEVYVYPYSVQFILSQITDLDPYESSVGRNTCTWFNKSPIYTKFRPLYASTDPVSVVQEAGRDSETVRNMSLSGFVPGPSSQ